MNGPIPHIVQYQGSKRILAPQILRYMPQRFERLVEPFAGMAAITIAVSRLGRANSYVVNDLNAPLMSILQSVIETPEDLVESYSEVWNEQFNQSPDKRRNGTSPKNLKPNVEAISYYLKGKTTFSSKDYREVLDECRPGDIVYMAPLISVSLMCATAVISRALTSMTLWMQ